MPINISRGSSLEFVAELFDALGNQVTPPVEIYLQISYTDVGGSSQRATIPMLGLESDYLGHWSAPSSASPTTMPIIALSLTASGAFSFSPPDPYLRIVK